MKKNLWIPVTILLLLPVPVVLLAHPVTIGSGVNGELFTGLSALDSLLAEASGRPVLLNFWATWCGPCVRELPELEGLALEMGEAAVFIAVDIGDPDLATLENFREGNPVGLTVVWLDPGEASLAAERYSLADVLPITVVLDGNGAETVRAAGARNIGWFRSALAGASPGELPEPLEQTGVHVYVVGSISDPAVSEMVQAALEIAGEDGYDFLDPMVSADSLLMEEAYLPMSGWPYAQLCVGGACWPPVFSAEDLAASYEDMR